MADPDIQTNPNPNGPSHLVVEQGLFARGTTAARPVAPAVDTEQAPDYETEPETSEPREIDPIENGGGSILLLIKANLFWVLLIPMVIIEIILLIMVVSN